jgi:hemolysin activation/secretion protein
MKKHNIGENELASFKIINKETIIKHLASIHKHKDNTHKEESHRPQPLKEEAPIKQASAKAAAPKETLQINLKDNKNFLPQTYFENCIKLETLESYIHNMNKDHNKQLHISDFIARVNKL